MTTKIITAVHKPYDLPDDGVHMPLFVGAAGKEDIGFTRDDSGDNISEKNPHYCELTGLYWAWKNLDSDYIGLEHYRRRFDISPKTIEKIAENDIYLPRRRNYFIESLYSHYAHSHYAEHLDLARDIISERYSEYYASLLRVYNQTGGYMFNMFIMKKELMDDYCSWLFDILFELEKRVDISEYDAFQARYLGRVSELLFNVWLDYRITEDKTLRCRTLKCIFTEGENWPKKIKRFLSAKFSGKKY